MFGIYHRMRFSHLKVGVWHANLVPRFSFLVSRFSFLVSRWRFAPISNLNGGKRRSYRR